MLPPIARLYLILLLATCQDKTTVSAFRWGGSEESPMRRYEPGDVVQVSLESSLTSIRTQLPLDAHRFLPSSCQSSSQDSENTQQRTAGLLYPLLETKVLLDVNCQSLCTFQTDPNDASKENDGLSNLIRHGYRHHWRIDDIPAALLLQIPETQEVRKHWSGGVPTGYDTAGYNTANVFNHFRLYIDYHQLSTGALTIVGFAIEAKSRNENSCAAFKNDDDENEGSDSITPEPQPVVPGGDLTFTYEVAWRASDVQWESRWEPYLTEDHFVPLKVHWYSLINSSVVVLLLAVVVALILLRNVRHNYEDNDMEEGDDDDDDDEQSYQELQDKGWKRIPYVFGPPTAAPLFLVACCGSGAQLLATCILTIFFMTFGLLSPNSFQDSVLPFALATYTLMGVLNGYVTGQLCRTFGQVDNWRRAARWASTLFPGLSLVLFTSLNVFAWSLGSNRALAPTTALGGSFLVTGIGAALTYMASWVSVQLLSQRVVLAQEPATILLGILQVRNFCQRSWKSKLGILLLLCLLNLLTVALACLWCLRRCCLRKCWSPACGGVFVLAFGAYFAFACIYVELFFLMMAAWMEQYYTVMGVLLLVTLLVVCTCGLVSMLVVYHQLTNNGDNVVSFGWWWQFAAGGSVSVLMGLWSLAWYSASLRCEGVYAPVMYAGSMLWACLALCFMMGFVGVAASIWFVNRLLSIAAASSQNSERNDPLVGGVPQLRSVEAKEEEKGKIEQGATTSSTLEVELSRPTMA